jgi:hypothetical protein
LVAILKKRTVDTFSGQITVKTTIQMKTFLFIFVLTVFTFGISSCQDKPIEIVFNSSQVDTATGLGELKIYKLKKQTKYSDFNYRKLADIDSNIKDTLNLRNLMPIFEPSKGHYNYFQFIATFKGEAYNGGEGTLIKDFHDILIIKTDDNNKILDSYQYTLEWAEPPCQFDLFKSKKTSFELTDNLDIEKLELTRTDYYSDKDKLHIEGGKLSLRK